MTFQNAQRLPGAGEGEQELLPLKLHPGSSRQAQTEAKQQGAKGRGQTRAERSRAEDFAFVMTQHAAFRFLKTILQTLLLMHAQEETAHAASASHAFAAGILECVALLCVRVCVFVCLFVWHTCCVVAWFTLAASHMCFPRCSSPCRACSASVSLLGGLQTSPFRLWQPCCKQRARQHSRCDTAWGRRGHGWV